MVKETMTFSVSGLKCDNPNCNWKDETIPYEEYIHYINKPCPKCGANLLTKYDYHVVKTLMLVSKLFGHKKVSNDEKLVKAKIHLNGTNQIGMEILDEK